VARERALAASLVRYPRRELQTTVVLEAGDRGVDQGRGGHRLHSSAAAVIAERGLFLRDCNVLADAFAGRHLRIGVRDAATNRRSAEVLAARDRAAQTLTRQ